MTDAISPEQILKMVEESKAAPQEKVYILIDMVKSVIRTLNQMSDREGAILIALKTLILRSGGEVILEPEETERAREYEISTFSKDLTLVMRVERLDPIPDADAEKEAELSDPQPQPIPAVVASQLVTGGVKRARKIPKVVTGSARSATRTPKR
jgi:hypothetical protein